MGLSAGDTELIRRLKRPLLRPGVLKRLGSATSSSAFAAADVEALIDAAAHVEAEVVAMCLVGSEQKKSADATETKQLRMRQGSDLGPGDHVL